MAEQTLPPGPRLPGAAQAVLWGLRYPQFTRAARERFGSTFTVRAGTMPPTVVTTDHDAIRRLHTGDPLVRHHGNDVVRPLVGDESVFLLEPGRHLARRKLLLPPFHGERVRRYADLMQRLMEREIACRRPGDTVQVLPIAQNVTIEVILQAVLGVGDISTRKRFRTLVDNVFFYPFGAARLNASGRLATRFKPPRRLRELAAFAASLPTPAVMTYFPETKARTKLNVGTWAWWRHRDRLIALLDEHIAASRSDPHLEERDDVLAMLVQARDGDGEGLSADALRDDLLALIAAGHETTAAALAWGAALLAHNPDVHERATVAAHDGDDEYLAALVKEVLRIRIPTGVASGRILDEPFPIGPYTIPAGTPILIDAWGVHHDPERYPDPERFDPERFVGRAPEPYAWLAFGGGAHRCIGAALAELELKVGLGTILRSVAVVPADSELAPAARRGIIVVPHGGGRVRVASAARDREPLAAVSA
jgi:cytochrome P450